MLKDNLFDLISFLNIMFKITLINVFEIKVIIIF